MVLNLIVGTFLKMRYRVLTQLICGVALLCTASRASEVCGVAIMVICGFQAIGGKRRVLLRLALATVAIFIVGWLAVDPTSFVRALFPTADTGLLVAESTGDDSLNGRLPLWTKVIDSMSVDNLMGTGFDGYRKWIFELSGWAGHAHNSVLDGILSGGYVGGALLMAYVFYGLFRSRKGFQSVPPQMSRCLILYAVLVGMMGPTLEDPKAMMYVAAAVYAVRSTARLRNAYRGAPLRFANAPLGSPLYSS